MHAACCALLALPAPAGAAAAAAPTRPYVVVYDTAPRADFPVAAETAARERRLGFEAGHRFRHALDGFAARLSAEDVRALRADPEVALVAPDRELSAARVPVVAGEHVPTGVRRIGAADAAGVHPPSGSAVAVLDTGVDLAHTDLAVRAGANCIGAGPPADDDGHGTFVAGVIGARNDGKGVVGVAPGTELYSVKVLSSRGAGLVSEVICGIDWVTANAKRLGIGVANMSLSGGGPSEALHLAIRRSVASGIVYTVAAGNSGIDIAREVPGSYPEVLTVTAMADSDGAGGQQGGPLCIAGEADDHPYTRTNFARTAVDAAHVVAAPGVCITSTARGGGKDTGTGTSASAPHAAGVVALCMGEAGRPGPCAGLTPAEVIAHVRADAAANATPLNGFLGDPLSPGDNFFGHLVSAVDPTVWRLPPRPAPATPPPAPAPAAQAAVDPDRVLDVLALRIARRQDVDRLGVSARLGEAATLVARATVRVPARAARRYSSRAVARVAPHETRWVRLRLQRAAVRKIKRALRRGVRIRARVRLRVTDPAGNSRTKSRVVRLRP